MTIFNCGLNYDSITIAQHITNHLIKNGFKNLNGSNLDNNITMGLSDDNQTAFLIYAYKDQKAIRVFIEDTLKRIRISYGVLSEDKKQVSKIKTRFFSIKKLSLASKYFEGIVRA